MELMIVEYGGPLSIGRMPPEAARAMSVYRGQVRRCTNVRDKDYKNYGGKGIRVKYSVRKFIQWYLNNLARFKGDNPHVGRVNHDLHYSFDNIEMVSSELNITERFNRRGPATPKKPVLAYKNSGEFVGRFSSANEAAPKFEISTHAIQNSCRNRRDRGYFGFYFRYE